MLQAALEAPRVLNLNNNTNFSGPYGKQIPIMASMIWFLIDRSSTFLCNDAQADVLMRIFCTGENVVFIANDWHTALLPVYLKAIYQPKGIYNNAKVSRLIFHLRKFSWFWYFKVDVV